MATINPELITQFENNPEQQFDLIVRTNGDATPYLPWFNQAGATVKQQFRLTPGVAIACAGATALQLLAEDWALSVEPDQTVTAL